MPYWVRTMHRCLLTSVRRLLLSDGSPPPYNRMCVGFENKDYSEAVVLGKGDGNLDEFKHFLKPDNVSTCFGPVARAPASPKRCSMAIATLPASPAA